MIGKIQLFEQLKKLEIPLFVTNKRERVRACEFWNSCITENISREILCEYSLIPLVQWQEKLGNKQKIKSINEYHVLAVDGSQIYPDRHEGICVALINIGGIFLFGLLRRRR